jgi:hypothetical protein
MLSGCASNEQTSPGRATIVPQSARTGVPLADKPGRLGCYGTFGVESTPCPVKLTKHNGGEMTVSVTGPGVAIAVVIASDCIGTGSVCNVTQIGYTEFEISSIRGVNPCGTAYVVFEGLTASLSPVGTATSKVINKYCQHNVAVRLPSKHSLLTD